MLEQIASTGVGSGAQATEAVPGSLRDRGFVDQIERGRIIGWAWNPARPDATVELEILDGDVPLLTVTADQPREDLREAGVGHGRYGFVVENIGALLPKSRHLIRIREVGTGLELPGSPRWVIRADAGLDEEATRFLGAVLSSVAANAQDLDVIDEALAFVVGRLSDLVNARLRIDPDARHAAEDIVADAAMTGSAARMIAALLDRWRPISLPAREPPVVSVIVPVHDQFALTYQCIESIARHLPSHAIEVIIVDDASRDETLFASLVFAGAIRVIRTVANLGFIGACNQGAAAARGRYVMFLNNDTLVHEFWLDRLVETLEEDGSIGIVGSRLLFADGRLQEAGGIVWKLGDAWNWGRGETADAPQFSYRRDVDYVSGAALMLARSLFEELGGFDPIYSPAYYEDTDLCFRARARGLRVVVQPGSTITHLEGASHGTAPHAGVKRHQALNNRVFYDRWKTTLAGHRATGVFPALEAERTVLRRAWFIDDVTLTPDQDAGSRAALEHIRALQRLGYKVTFIPAYDLARPEPYTSALQAIGVECLYTPFVTSVEDALRQAIVAPDVVVLHRFANAAKYATLVRDRFPLCRMVFNVGDLHFLREAREADVLGDERLRTASLVRRERELAAMRLVDCVLVYSDVEAALLQPLVPEARVEQVGWTVMPDPTAIPFAERAGYGFVGGFRHPPNPDAVMHFTGAIMPLVSAPPGQRFVIIGSNLPDRIARLHGQGIDVRGHVPVLSDAVHRLRATIAPLRFGAGIKGKVLDSLALGVPCVMSGIAAEGLPIEGDLTWLIARDDATFAARLERLLTDEAWNAHLAQAGLAMIRTWFGAARLDARFAELLG
jgi:GT2 family glycosyltransferase